MDKHIDNNQTHNHYESTLIKVSWLYYIENMTQKEIADRIGVTRLKVVKMLEEARNNNLIQFKIPTFHKNKILLEKQLINKYDLKDVLIVPTKDGNDKDINQSIAHAAAMYINDTVPKNSFINMGYGDTVNKVINNLAQFSEKDISIISMTGGVKPYLPNNQSHIFNAQLFLIPSPLVMSSVELTEMMLKEKSVNDILEMINLASMSVISVGGMSQNSTVINSNIVTEEDLTKLKMKGAVGDVLLHFIDSEGNLIESDVEERLVSLSLNKLKSLKNVMCVAGGTNKIEAIHALLKGHYPNIFITDEQTALKLIETER